MLRARRVGRQERQIDVRLLHLRQLDLGLFRGFLQTLHGHAILADVDALILFEFRDQPVDHAIVDVIAAEMRVAGSRLHFDHAFAHFQDGNIERAAAKIVDRDGLVLLFVQAVSQRRGGRLVDDAKHFHARHFARLLGRLPLAVVEIRRDRDDRLGHLLAEKILGGGLQLLQNHCGKFRRGISLAENFDARIIVRPLCNFVGHALGLVRHFIKSVAHEPLDRIDRIFRIGHRLALGHLADQPLARLGDGHDRRGGSPAFLVRDHHRLPALHHGNNRIGRPQVNSYNFAHR